MTDDAELLRRYAEERSETAFAEFVERRVGLVYAAALRRVSGDEHAAKEVAQQVFTTVARRAAALARHDALTGWLYTATRNAAVNLRRDEQRRRLREREASAMNELLASPAPEADWDRLRTVIDEAMDELAGADREAVLLRFFEGRPFAEVGAKLQLTENTARMRVDRALDKLRIRLAQRGITSTSAALGVVLASEVGVAAPAGLAATVTGAALAAAASVGGAAGIFAFMSTTKVVTGVVVVIAIGAMGIGFFQFRRAQTVDATVASRPQAHGQPGAQFAAAEAPTPSAQAAAREAGNDGATPDAADATPLGRQREPLSGRAAAVETQETAPARFGREPMRMASVLGAVQKPGVVYFPAQQDLTLVQAIVIAGGFGRIADKHRVSIRRLNAENKRETVVIDMDAILKGKAEDTWALQPGDVVVVPEILF